mgnify:FL=1|jgi:protein-disulfide isomerase
MEHQKNAVNNMKPKSAFKAGLLSGLGIMFVIGFFILLGILLNDKMDDGDKDTNKNTNNNVVNTNTNPGADTGTKIAVEGLSDGDWFRGDKNAPITIVEFSDIDCPYCSRFHSTMVQIADDYDGAVNWVYRHFPLPSLHPEATKKAEATECVGELGGNDKFWEFLDLLFENTTEKLADLSGIASGIGINADDFQSCLDSGRHASKVQGHSGQAQAAGGRGTPHSIIIVGDTTIPIQGAQPYESIAAQLDSILQ